jgi:RNA polymerase sigma factor (sigma-70 family)
VDNNDLDSEQHTLWQSFKEGDRKAFDVLLQQYYRHLLNYGLRLDADKVFVEDCLQDFFIDLWNKKTGLGDAKSLKAYLLSSFRRKLFRERGKNSQLTSLLSDDYNFDVQFDIETQLIEKEHENENAEKLKYQLENLTKRQREAIYLRFYQGLDYADIAQIMAVNPHSAINLVYESLKLLRQNWFISLFYLASKLF